ncbi:MAG: YhbD family protein [Actinomycetes bacterium]|jgi:DNA-binding transcriptional MerR regulator|nr:YhbD family protein [Actinomycetes bacterium]
MQEISKKELLAATGISYGQLYRWKRERLIPEEWFIKRSAFTGQETYFPRQQMLDRVNAIIDLKDGYSLDEIRTMLAEDYRATFTRDELLATGLLPTEVLTASKAFMETGEFRRIDAAFLLFVTSEAHSSGAGAPAVTDLVQRTLPLMLEQQAADTVCQLLGIDGALYVVLMRDGVTPAYDPAVRVLATSVLVNLTGKFVKQHAGSNGKNDGDKDTQEEGAQS